MSALTDTFSDIADAIREKTGESDLISPSNMASAIADIVGGGSLNYMIIPYEAAKTTTTNYVYTFPVEPKFVWTAIVNYAIYDISNNKFMSLADTHNYGTSNDGYAYEFTPQSDGGVWTNGMERKARGYGRYTGLFGSPTYTYDGTIAIKVTKNNLTISTTGTAHALLWGEPEQNTVKATPPLIILFY